MATPKIRKPWAEFTHMMGMNLQRARQDAGLTQESVAHSAGISTFTYQKLEKGESNPGSPANPRLQTLVALSLVLGRDIAELLPEVTDVLLLPAATEVVDEVTVPRDAR